MEIHQNLTNQLTAANKNLDVLKAHFGHCFDKQGDFQMEKFQAELLAGEVNFSKESYGLDWLGRSYARLLASDAAMTLLKEDEAFNRKPENANSQNLLIKGDNLEILKHLSNAYFEKVKMIYIDPPYNTGGDGFVYQDDRKFTVKELQRLAGVSEEKAKRILEFTMSKSNSHSAWLTFMYPRLYIAKELLKDDGVIFVSIDDNEVAQLRLLMDEVFGEENFVDQIIWRKKSGGGQQDEHFVTEHDYLTAYAKKKSQLEFKDIVIKKTDVGYNNYDVIKCKKFKYVKLAKWGTAAHKENRRTMHFPITDPDGNESYPIAPDGRPGRWRYGKQAIKTMLKEDRIEFLKVKDEWIAYEKDYAPGEDDVKIIKERTIFYDLVENTDGANELSDLFRIKDIFTNPKPTDLIQHLIPFVSDDESDDVILDFFAGSGTTGDAVMQLNAENGGKRKFILAQLPEKIDPEKSQVAYDFVKNELGVEEPTIFEITKERLIRAANKLREERPVEVAGQDLGFKVFETIPLWEDYHHKAETLEEDTPAPFRGDLLGVDDLQALFITWKTYDGSPLTEAPVDYDLGGYIGKYVNASLYLMDNGFTTDHLVTLLEKVESDADFNPRSVIVFESNFQSKNLRELSESLKNFQNQKSLEIDFIMRF